MRSAASWIAGVKGSALCKRGLEANFTGECGVPPAWQSYLGLLARIKGGGLEKFFSQTVALLGLEAEMASILLTISGTPLRRIHRERK